MLAETISTLARRVHEKRRAAELPSILSPLHVQYPPEMVVWLFPEVPSLYSEVVELVLESAGELNFNDALIALSCRRYGITALASFDRDFDSVVWLKRVATPSNLLE